MMSELIFLILAILAVAGALSVFLDLAIRLGLEWIPGPRLSCLAVVGIAACLLIFIAVWRWDDRLLAVIGSACVMMFLNEMVKYLPGAARLFGEG